MLFRASLRRLVVGFARGRVGRRRCANRSGEALEPRCLLAAPQTFELASLLPDNGGDGSITSDVVGE